MLQWFYWLFFCHVSICVLDKWPEKHDITTISLDEIAKISLDECVCVCYFDLRSFSRFSSYIKKVIDDNNQAEGTATLLKVSSSLYNSSEWY